MKKTTGLILVFVGVLLFCALNASYHAGNGIDGPRQTVSLGVPDSPWLSFVCVEFAEDSPRGCAQWQTSFHWKSWSWLGLLVLGLGSFLAREPLGAPASSRAAPKTQPHA